ncbi:MAG: hypothetical protein ACR2LN_03720 [Candidatus Levyibacteriota bacterium]
MQNKKETSIKKRIVWAFIAGLLLLYIGSFVLAYGGLFLRGYIDQTYYESAYTKLLYVHSFDYIPLHTMQNVIMSVSAAGVISGIEYVLMILLFIISGATVTKIAKNLPWISAVFPSIFVSLFSFHQTVEGNYNILSYPISFVSGNANFYLIGIFLLSALLGGFLQRHVSIHK